MKKINRIFIVLATLFCLVLPLQAGGAKDSKTHYAKDALQPFVDSGELPGAINVFYKDGVQETCCVEIGRAHV